MPRNSFKPEMKKITLDLNLSIIYAIRSIRLYCELSMNQACFWSFFKII